METRLARIETVNVLAERSRLAPELLARWRGLPLGWFDAAATVRNRRSFVTPPMLAVFDAGRAQASFDFGRGLQTYDLRPGALRVFDGRRVCRLNEWACRSARRIMIELDASRLDDPDALAGLRQDLDFRDDELVGVARAMVHEVAAGCPHGALYAESLSIGLLLRLARSHGRSRRERGTLTAAQLRRVDELIDAGLDGGLSLDDMAGAAGYSKAQFVRLFRRSTGTSPHRHVLLRRLGRARRLIETTTLSLAEVASEAGFASQSHMTHTFARFYGRTPGDVRRDAQR